MSQSFERGGQGALTVVSARCRAHESKELASTRFIARASAQVRQVVHARTGGHLP